MIVEFDNIDIRRLSLNTCATLMSEVLGDSAASRPEYSLRLFNEH
jgi:hypothetical protein